MVVTDTLPPEVAFVSADPPQDSGPQPAGLEPGRPGRGRDPAADRDRPGAGGDDRRLHQRGRRRLRHPDDNPGNNADESPTTPLVPGLELTKGVAPGQAVRSMPFTYTIRITNTGQVTFNPLVLTDTLPADFHYVVELGRSR